MNTLVEVKPIEVKKWHGKTGKETFTQPLVLEALLDPITGKYATGLDDEMREKLEAKTGYNLSDTYDADTPHEFWSSKQAQIDLPARTTIFDISKPLDYIKVSVLKASKFVANSQRELDQGLFPDAMFVIFDEREEATIKAGKIQKIRKANKIASELTTDEKVNLVQVLSGKSLRGQSQDFLDVAINDLIEDDINDFLKYATMDKEQVYMRALVLEAIYKNVLQKEGSAILYLGDRIGFNVDEAVKYLSNPENQTLKVMILEKMG